jgi:hypothetical protein
MVGVSQNDLGLGIISELVLMYTLDGTQGSDRHKNGGFNRSVSCGYMASTGFLVLGFELKFQT